jgi:RNA polymerase sigma-70 factor (ECF subfamily)
VHTSSTGGDDARGHAFRTHVGPEVEVLLRVARTLTNSWVDAEDLAQETLIRAYRAIDRFDGAHPRAWLLTILRHTHLNMNRRTRPDLIDDWSTLPNIRPAFAARDQPSTEEQIMDTILDEDLERAVSALDPRFRTVVLLVDVDQLSYAEAAQVLDVPVGTIMSRLSRGRDRLRTHLRHAAALEGRTR